MNKWVRNIVGMVLTENKDRSQYHLADHKYRMELADIKHGSLRQEFRLVFVVQLGF
jgi:hypothetical protein